MPIHFTVDRAATWCADQLLSRQQLTDARKNEIRPATKYNLLVTAFNSSTVLLVASVILAVFFAYTAAFTLLALGLFTRFTTEKEIQKYTLPLRQDEQQQAGAAGMWERLREAFAGAMLRHALHQATPEEKVENIFQNVRLPRQPNWEQDEVFVFDYAFWKNKIDVPDAIQQAIPPERLQEPPAALVHPTPSAQGGVGLFAGIVQRVMGQPAAAR